MIHILLFLYTACCRQQRKNEKSIRYRLCRRDKQPLLYCRAEIALKQTCAFDAPEIIEIIPGMTVQANIETGTKSILAYLLRPISRGFDNALSER